MTTAIIIGRIYCIRSLYVTPYRGDITVNQFSYDYYDYSQEHTLNDVIIEHHEYYGTYQYECGKTFIDVCIDMGLDKNSSINLSFL